MDNTFDKLYYNRGDLIAGVDESGVSDIAGPLVSACVILPKYERPPEDLRIFEIDDSKKIKEKYREGHLAVILSHAIGIGIGVVEPAVIDFVGKRRATLLAMAKAVAACQQPEGVKNRKSLVPDLLLIDGELDIPIEIEQVKVKNGDEFSLCIAAASIVAKVFRDVEMNNLHEKYPHYSWNKNKGHPCEKHFKGIDSHGIVPGVHRIRYWPFVPNREKGESERFWDVRRGIWKNKTADVLLKTAAPQMKLKELCLRELTCSSKQHRQKKSAKSGKT